MKRKKEKQRVRAGEPGARNKSHLIGCLDIDIGGWDAAESAKQWKGLARREDGSREAQMLSASDPCHISGPRDAARAGVHAVDLCLTPAVYWYGWSSTQGVTDTRSIDRLPYSRKNRTTGRPAKRHAYNAICVMRYMQAQQLSYAAHLHQCLPCYPGP